MIKRIRACFALIPLCVLAGCGGPSESDLQKFYSTIWVNPKVSDVQCVESAGQPGYTCTFMLNGRSEKESFVKSGNGWRWAR